MADTTLNLNLNENQRAQRKLLITVAAWGTSDANKEIIGVRTEDSSIEFNIDSETSTDILGKTYSDVNKTEPQQDFDPHYIIGKSKLDAYLTQAALQNNIDAYNGTFNIYVIAAFISNGTGGIVPSTGTTDKFYCVKHKGCSIFPTSIGGDTYTSMPLEVHFSNDIEEGYVDKLDASFTFTKVSGNDKIIISV